MKQQAYLETRRRGTPGFPMEYYRLDATHPRYVMEPHWHPEMEFIRVLGGTFSAHLNNQPFLLSAGDVLLVECGCLHRGEPAGGCVYDCAVFALPQVGEPYGALSRCTASLSAPDAGITRLITAADGGLYRAVNLFLDEVRDKPAGFELTAYGRLFLIVAQLYADGTVGAAPTAPRSRGAHTVIRVLERLETGFREEFSLSALAAEAGVSEKYLCRLFKEYTGQTMVDYVNERRVENACYEMTAGGQSITRAALDSGFNDLSYFCKLFRRYKGMTPSEFRKQAR